MSVSRVVRFAGRGPLTYRIAPAAIVSGGPRMCEGSPAGPATKCLWASKTAPQRERSRCRIIRPSCRSPAPAPPSMLRDDRRHASDVLLVLFPILHLGLDDPVDRQFVTCSSKTLLGQTGVEDARPWGKVRRIVAGIGSRRGNFPRPSDVESAGRLPRREKVDHGAGLRVGSLVPGDDSITKTRKHEKGEAETEGSSGRSSLASFLLSCSRVFGILTLRAFSTDVRTARSVCS